MMTGIRTEVAPLYNTIVTASLHLHQLLLHFDEVGEREGQDHHDQA